MREWINVQKTIKTEFWKRSLLRKKRKFQERLMCNLKELKENIEALWNKGSYKIKLPTNPGKEIEETHEILKYLKTICFKKKAERNGKVKIRRWTTTANTKNQKHDMGRKLDKVIHTAKGQIIKQNVKKIIGVQKWLSIHLHK